MRFRSRLLTLLLCSASFVVASHAQGRASIFGTVTDNTGAAIANATVTLTNNDTQQTQSTTSSSTGAYTIPSIIPGHYSLAISAPGFQSYVARAVTLAVDQNFEVSPKLVVGAITQEVVVSDEATVQVDTHSPTLSEVVDTERVKEMPLNGRDPLQLQYLVAGAGAVTAGGGGQAESQQVAINGNRPTANNYTLDGADNEDPFFNTPSVVPNPDALDQFSMKTSNYGANEGRSSGSQSNAILKSGSNSYHGLLFEYLRNSAMDAQNYFRSPQKPPYKRNQFGGTFGGPIIHNKLFFFFAYQGTRMNSSPSGVTIVVPTPAERGGNFADMLPATVVKIPGTSTAATNNDLSAYANSAATAFLKDFVPLPNTGSNKYAYNPVSKINEDQYVGTLNYSLGTKDMLFGHIVYLNNKTTQEPSTSDLPGFLAQINYENWNVAVNEVHTFSPHLLNMFVFGFNDITRHQLPIVPAQQTWASLGSGIVRAVPSAIIGWETNVTGYFVAQSRWQLNQLRSGYQFSDTLTWTRGNHNLSLGGDVRPQFTDQSQNYRTDAQLAFGGGYTGNALADLVVGRPTTINQQSNNGGKPASTTPDLFAMDDWKVTNRLTLNIGVRWEPFVPLHDRLNHVSQYRAGEQSTVMPHAPVGYVFPGDKGVPTNTYSARWNVFAVRTGFAYDLFGNGKTSLRGGFGIFDSNVWSQALNNISTNVPFAYSVSLASPTGGLTNPYQDIGGSPFPFTVPSTSQYSTYTFNTPLAALVEFAPNFRNSRVDQWSTNVQQELPGRTVLTVAYVGSAGEHLEQVTEANAAVYGAAGSTTQARRINPTFSSIQDQFSGGHSSFNGLELTFNKPMNHGVTVLTSYTWARSFDSTSSDTTGSVSIFNPFNLRSSRGPSDFDIKSAFVTSFIWTLPAPKIDTILNRALLKGWELNGIIKLQTGLPFTVTSGVDNSKSGVGLDHADQIGPIQTFNGSGHAKEAARWFNTGSYASNAVGTFGSAGRNTVVGPGYEDIDLGFNKTLPTPEAFKMIFRAEAFNLFNHANFANPAASYASQSTFGVITSTRSVFGDPRDMQVSLRVEF